MVDKKQIQELADLLKENELTEISVKEGDKEIVLKRGGGVFVPPAAAPVAVQTQAVSAEASAPAQSKGKPVTSPMVGTFYKAASPDSKPFVEIGSVVAAGQVVCIIEAMKLMNEIESEVSGKVTEICVEDGQPIEFGQVLMYVE